MNLIEMMKTPTGMVGLFLATSALLTACATTERVLYGNTNKGRDETITQDSRYDNRQERTTSRRYDDRYRDDDRYNNRDDRYINQDDRRDARDDNPNPNDRYRYDDRSTQPRDDRYTYRNDAPNPNRDDRYTYRNDNTQTRTDRYNDNRDSRYNNPDNRYRDERYRDNQPRDDRYTYQNDNRREPEMSAAEREKRDLRNRISDQLDVLEQRLSAAKQGFQNETRRQRKKREEWAQQLQQKREELRDAYFRLEKSSADEFQRIKQDMGQSVDNVRNWLDKEGRNK